MKDILIAAKYGIFQVVGDTVGPAAMMAAFRTIPVYLDICKKMEKLAPEAVFINHANPMAILCRAINKHTRLKDVIGICHGVQEGIAYAEEILQVAPGELDTTWIGTNHYYWFTKVYHKGKDVYPKLKKKLKSSPPQADKILSRKLSQIYGYHIVYPHDDHAIEFYPFLAQVKNGTKLPYDLARSMHGVEVTKMYKGKKTGGKKQTRKQMLKEFEESLDTTKLSPEAGLEGVMELVEALCLGKKHLHIVNIPNRTAVPNLPPFAVLEVKGVTDSTGVRSFYTGEAPLVLKGLLEKIIAWQEVVVDAAVKGDRDLALQALMLDPAAIVPEKAEKMLGELLRNSQKYLPQFQGS